MKHNCDFYTQHLLRQLSGKSGEGGRLLHGLYSSPVQGAISRALHYLNLTDRPIWLDAEPKLDTCPSMSRRRAKKGYRFERSMRSLTPRDVLIRVDPVELDQALQKWNEQYGSVDESLAIDGKTMCNAIDDNGRQVHIMSVVGHQSGQCYTQKKWALSL